MAEESLKIKVTIEDVGGKTASELKGIKKELVELQGATKIGSDEFKGYQSQIDLINKSVSEAQGKHSNFKQEIREARQEARLFRFVLLEGIHGLDGMATAFSFLSGQSESSKRSMKGFTDAAKEGLSAGLGLSFALSQIGLAGAGGIGIAVGAITALGSALNAQEEAAKKAAEEMDKLLTEYLRLENQLGRLSRAQNLNNLQADVDISKGKERIEIQKIRDSIVAENTPAAQARKRQLEEEAIAHSAVILALRKEIDEREIILKDAQDKYTDIDKKGQEDRAKQEETNEKKETELTLLRIKIAGEKAKEEKRKALLSWQNVVPQPVKVRGGEETTDMPFEKAIGNWMVGIGILQSGFAALGNEIQNGIVRAFGEATSLFQIFVQGVVQGIAQIAEQLASAAIISGIFSLFNIGTGGMFGSIFKGLTGFASGGTLNEPVVGFGASGRAYSFGENGPERFSPLTSGGSSGSQSMQIYGETHLKNEHIVIAWKNGRTRDRMRGANY